MKINQEKKFVKRRSVLERVVEKFHVTTRLFSLFYSV